MGSIDNTVRTATLGGQFNYTPKEAVEEFQTQIFAYEPSLNEKVDQKFTGPEMVAFRSHMENVLNSSSNIEERRNAYKALEGLELVRLQEAWDRVDDTPFHTIDTGTSMAGHIAPDDYLSLGDLAVFLTEFEHSQTLEGEPLIVEDELPIILVPEDEPLIVE